MSVVSSILSTAIRFFARFSPHGGGDVKFLVLDGVAGEKDAEITGLVMGCCFWRFFGYGAVSKTNSFVFFAHPHNLGYRRDD